MGLTPLFSVPELLNADDEKQNHLISSDKTGLKERQEKSQQVHLFAVRRCFTSPTNSKKTIDIKDEVIHMKRISDCLSVLCGVAMLTGALPAHGVETHLLARTGIAVAPAYQGAKKYKATPILGFEAGVQQQDWGTLSASEMGLLWQAPLSGPFGIAFIVGYDTGRNEDIRTMSGRDKSLKGMGKLSGAVEAGTELSYHVEPYRLYMKALRALKKRQYGGEDLSYTTHGNLGADITFPLASDVSTTLSLLSSWGDKQTMQAYFGVTRQQAQNTAFRQYQPKAGFKDVTLQAVLNYQLTPAIALQSSWGGYYLLGEAAKSPITEKNLGGFAFISGSYTF